MTTSQIDPPPNPQAPHNTGPRRLSWKWLLLSPVLVAAFFGVRGTTQNSAPVTVAQAQALPVETTVLEAVNQYTVERTYTGEIAARRTSDLGFERAGSVIAIRVDDGDRVEAGASIAQLDTRDLVAQRQQLEAQKRGAIAQLQELQTGPRPEDIAAARSAVGDLRNQVQLAKLQQQRRSSLYSEGAISREEMEEKKFSAGALENRLQQAQSQLNELLAGTRREQITGQDAQVAQLDASIRAIDISLSKSILKAPFSGIVSARTVDEGVVVGAGQSVLRLVEGNNLEARMGIPNQVAETLTRGSIQKIKVQGQQYSAKVTGKLPELEGNSRTVTVVLQLSGIQELTVGSTARLILKETEPAQGFWMPTAALVKGDRGLWSAYVVKANNDVYKVARRDVEILYTEGSRSLVRGMVESGDRIITRGTHRIVPDQLVTFNE
ncbi:Toluene efflux pump periplasmic linker protein TtgG [Acaryochloris thomasi RCC1774]|uniref:Toluene efflux pump periplasmic linker protein TtgG n=1 Tax=Acaryochloris thomasi RCC1774 TaxID=1764569 RepID=A0A2W1J730_9CYAN|nr:efflux RND transporter periplasmic adaptor subunit [Acaryochloris thomasi]PZD70340.1 Toluene efflux pump periplasmic linker protein TtgG [Acaryochloris thomasi RCC1774]